MNFKIAVKGVYILNCGGMLPKCVHVHHFNIRAIERTQFARLAVNVVQNPEYFLTFFKKNSISSKLEVFFTKMITDIA